MFFGMTWLARSVDNSPEVEDEAVIRAELVHRPRASTVSTVPDHAFLDGNQREACRSADRGQQREGRPQEERR